jgi:hypothetical protein
VAGERLKFRCYQCNQLLASAPGKAGSIVSCPRCKADLVVPGPESRGPGDSDTSAVGKMSGRGASTVSVPRPTGPGELDEVAADIPADLIDLRPEDLRVEAEFFHSLTRAPQPAAEPEPTQWSAPAAAAPYPGPEPAIPATPAISAAVIDRPAPVPQPSAGFRPEMFGVPPASAPIQPLLPPLSPDVPPIEIETPSLRSPAREVQMVREVVLPASAVLAWSLFGLIGIATSFIAGLMVGHYFWRM